VSEEKNRIRQIAIDKFEARMCGDGDIKRISSPLLTLRGDDFGLNEAIKYFPKFLRYALKRIFIFPEAVKCYTTIIAQSNDKQNMVDLFNKECESCVLLVGNILERLPLLNPQEELDFLDKYESWCEKAKKQLNDEIAAMEQKETMTLALIHRAKKLEKERNALAEQLQTFVGRIIGRIIKEIEWDQNRDQRRKAAEHRKITSQKAEEAEQDGKDGQIKTNIPDYKALNLAKVPISRLIEQGESHTLEFKEIPECNTQQNRKNNDVLFPPLKTIAGFLNAEGGILLIGVDNSGKIVGIEPYLNTMEQGNNDTFEQQIRNCLRDRFEPYPIGKVKVSFEKFMEGTVCRIDVQADKEPVNLDNEVYVRDGNTTQLLKGRRLTDWIQQRRLLTALPSGK
jgi:hypothetical protein